MKRALQAGFTLIEILVAVAIMVILGYLAYGTVAEVRKTTMATEARLDRLKEVQRGMHLLVADFRTIAPRPVRETIGDGYRAALLRDPNTLGVVELSHGGWPNGAGTPRGTVQRVSYRLEEGKLIREHWYVTDTTLANPPVRRELLQDVLRFEIRYMNSGREWISEWPPLGSAGDFAFRTRPLAVEITIELEDYGVLRRLVEVPG